MPVDASECVACPDQEHQPLTLTQTAAARTYGENDFPIADNTQRLPERRHKMFAALTG